jgi:hypothetical protein
MKELPPIPTLVRYVCESGHQPTIAEAGGQYLCQNCVNEFLAKNVGFMRELPEPINSPPPPEGVEGDGTG